MSCRHGNPIANCDLCDDVDAAFEAGRQSMLTEYSQPVQPEQEPFTYYDPVRDSIRPFRGEGDIPLYTTPPQRTWVGLTNDEIEMIVENRRAAHWEFMRQVEELLRSKNT